MKAPALAVSQTIPAPAGAIYGVLADYRTGHPQILPKPYFQGVEVEQGGVGAGTVIRVTMRMGGSTQTLRMQVTEPEPGRVLQESDPAVATTRFTVEPLESGAARVTIATEWAPHKGLRGLMERWLLPAMCRPVYVKELALLADYLQGRPAQ